MAIQRNIIVVATAYKSWHARTAHSSAVSARSIIKASRYQRKNSLWRGALWRHHHGGGGQNNARGVWRVDSIIVTSPYARRILAQRGIGRHSWRIVAISRLATSCALCE